MKRSDPRFLRAAPYLLFAAVCAALMFGLDATRPQTGWLIASLTLAALCGAGLAVFALQKKLTDARFFALLLTAAFFLHLAYVLYTGHAVRQHDVNSFESRMGHAGYIKYLLEHRFALPDFDVRIVYQFYQPPLWHLTAAGLVRLFLAAGQSLARAFESLQFFSLYLSTCCALLIVRLLRELELKGFALRVSAAILICHPVFIYMAGFLNNDLPALTLVLAALLFTVRWYKNPSWSNILFTALFLGLSMMAKLNSGLVVPGIALVFLWKWGQRIRQKDRPLRLFGQFAAFAALCVPLALWWQLRNFLLYGVPANYVPVSGMSEQDIGGYGLLRRLFVPQLRFPYVALPYFNDYAEITGLEHNIPTALLKTSLFGEWTFGATNRPIAWLSYGLFWVNALLVALSLFALASVVVRGRKERRQDAPLRALLALVVLSMTISQFLFCLQYPDVCTQNIRYIVPAVVAGSALIGLWLSDREREERLGRGLRGAINALAVLFCLLSAGVYVLLSGLF